MNSDEHGVGTATAASGCVCSSPSVATEKGDEDGFAESPLAGFSKLPRGPFSVIKQNNSTVFDLIEAVKHLQNLCKFLGSLFILIWSSPNFSRIFENHLIGK